MPRWSDYTTGARIKILRGKDIRQSDLAEMTGLSLPTIQQAEQDKRLTLQTLLLIADALRVDTSVILGQQGPRRAMEHDDRTVMRALSQTVHDVAAGILPDTVTAPSLEKLLASNKRLWKLYWNGKYVEAGSLAAPLLTEAAARLHEQPAGEQAEAWGLLADGYRLASYVANLMGSRDLAYAAIGHAQHAAVKAADSLRTALVMSGRSWVYLRDARLPEALRLAEKAATDIEPRFSKATTGDLVAYGSHINFAAVVASRMKDKERVKDYLSQSHATGARMGKEAREHGTVFGPVTATTQAVGINVALGQSGKALALMKDINPDHEAALSGAARHRYAMDKAMAQADAKMWDTSLDTLETALLDAPEWARHQALPSIIVQRVGKASTSRLRRVSKLIGVAAPGAEGFRPATTSTAL
ncbi:helix-turn-helix domain-containing protein [Streptomyces sp. MUM 178J]|uniref:helix-turn-helix domain-containing protein n=1 Tax=Streptomyces sp. MUM 178J TaxID=2791991 RepID=UPI001F04F50C|nr:helix-turn-helix transcriptional regulator [Streptomyces sp. MUM 178J]WRQ81159.1 helix-turn-helix transcriptional regulator [Streptomyces sp. MUM 178J]